MSSPTPPNVSGQNPLIPQGLYRLVNLEAQKKKLREETRKIEELIKKEELREHGTEWYEQSDVHSIPIEHGSDQFGAPGELRRVEKVTREGFSAKLVREHMPTFLMRYKGVSEEEAKETVIMGLAFCEAQRKVTSRTVTLERTYERTRKRRRHTNGMAID